MLKGMLQGLATTMKHQVKVDAITVQYPEEKRTLPKRARWRHVLNRYEDPNDPNFGMERCIG